MPYDANGNYYAASSSDQSAPSDFDTQFGQYIPLDILGSRGRMQASRDVQTQDANRQYWNALQPPSAQQLDSQAGQQAQTAALGQLQAWGNGGLTNADRGAMEVTRGRDQQAADSQQRGLMQEAQARGVGGSGLDYATRQQSAQQGQQQTSDAESQMLQGAQQRALQSIQASGQLGGQIRTQAGQGQQRAFEDQSSRAAGATGQYGTDAQQTQAGRDRRQQSDTSLMGLVGGLLSS